MATPVAVGGRHRQSRCCEFVTSRGSELDKGGVTDARAIAWLACSAGPNVGRDVSVIWPNERSGATERATAKSAQPNGAKLLLPYAGGAGRSCFLVRNNTYDIRATFQNRPIFLTLRNIKFIKRTGGLSA